MAKWGDGEVIEELIATIEELRKALKQFGEHSIYCTYSINANGQNKRECSCGFFLAQGLDWEGNPKNEIS